MHPIALALAALGTASLLFHQASAHEHYGAGFADSAPANGVADADEPLRLFPPPDKEFRNAQGQTEPAAAGPLRLYHVSGPFAGQEKVFDLLPRPVGFRPAQRCGGYYVLDEYPRTLEEPVNSPYQDAFSFTALSDGGTEDLDPRHAHTGAYIRARIVAVAGPAGAHFGYWKANWSLNNDAPYASFAAHEPIPAEPLDPSDPQASGIFHLSQGYDGPEEDPAGHIHLRSWTADQPGDYFITFRLLDTSTNRPGGAPWHTPSKDYILHFRASPSFQPVAQRIPGTGLVLTWPSLMGTWDDDLPAQTGIVFTIERSTTLDALGWTPVGAPVTGTTAPAATFTDPAPPAGKAFYRLKYDWATP